MGNLTKFFLSIKIINFKGGVYLKLSTDSVFMKYILALVCLVFVGYAMCTLYNILNCRNEALGYNNLGGLKSIFIIYHISCSFFSVV